MILSLRALSDVTHSQSRAETNGNLQPEDESEPKPKTIQTFQLEIVRRLPWVLNRRQIS